MIRKSVATLSMALLMCASGAAAQSPWTAKERAVSPADSFAIRMNGQQFGTYVSSVQRTADGYRFTETTTTPASSQSTEVLLSDAFAARRVRQTGQAQGMEMRIDVAYADGRAKGTAVTPGPGGMTERNVDAEVPADVLDDNVVTALIPALDWKDGASWELNVFSSGSGRLVKQTLRVTGTATVDVKGAPVEAWRAEVLGGDATLIVYAMKAAPHRMLRLEIQGTPLDVVRIN